MQKQKQIASFFFFFFFSQSPNVSIFTEFLIIQKNNTKKLQNPTKKQQQQQIMFIVRTITHGLDILQIFVIQTRFHAKRILYLEANLFSIVYTELVYYYFADKNSQTLPHFYQELPRSRKPRKKLGYTLLFFQGQHLIRVNTEFWDQYSTAAKIFLKNITESVQHLVLFLTFIQLKISIFVPKRSAEQQGRRNIGLLHSSIRHRSVRFLTTKIQKSTQSAVEIIREYKARNKSNCKFVVFQNPSDNKVRDLLKIQLKTPTPLFWDYSQLDILSVLFKVQYFTTYSKQINNRSQHLL
eukprot:TRINITY_DN9911_c0_g1_i1.p2 TRINITY_DN9911_c0_g1~~TRINITY_DN9911_c0_g1_i1.p2  ORF type:complete len:296 (+),score=10.36 TRINITY_DN9911_c0_g1_i1:103-990(+)